ncbi:MAG TPA: MmgE/PrpD family protein [Chloroflexota bacterium]
MTSVAVATTAPVTERVARFAASQDVLKDAPEALLERATRAAIDTVGVAVAARHEPSFTILAATIGAGGGPGEATALPTRTRTNAAQAAFLNGTAGHALDFDDVADEITGHPSVVLVPTLLALAEATGRSGREFLEAYVVGFEVACAIARGLPVEPHYRLGWHATATIGILGATAGAGRLLGLDEVCMRNALGIAASMAGGSRQNFGTMTKPLHAGLVARDAVVAAQLAANGFTADQNHLEAPLGYFQLYGVNPDPGEILDALGAPRVLLDRGLNVKKYACCYGTHRMADAALAMHVGGLRAADVRSIDVNVGPGGLEAIIHHQPRTGLQGKFSGEYVVASCLLDGGVRLSTFSDERVSRPAVQDLLRRVHIQESTTPPFGPADFEVAYATVEATLHDGSLVRERCDIPRGHARAPLSDAELEAKFRDCLEFAASDWDADSLLENLRNLRSAPSLRDVFA